MGTYYWIFAKWWGTVFLLISVFLKPIKRDTSMSWHHAWRTVIHAKWKLDIFLKHPNLVGRTNVSSGILMGRRGAAKLPLTPPSVASHHPSALRAALYLLHFFRVGERRIVPTGKLHTASATLRMPSGAFWKLKTITSDFQKYEILGVLQVVFTVTAHSFAEIACLGVI